MWSHKLTAKLFAAIIKRKYHIYAMDIFEVENFIEEIKCESSSSKSAYFKVWKYYINHEHYHLLSLERRLRSAK